jgi:acyl carrier protein
MWNHSDDARDKCGEVTDLRIQGDDLHATFVIALPEDARRLQLLNDEVSVEVTPNAVDGEGNKYDLLLTHVGVVTLPVVPGQGPIRRLALAQEGNDVPEDKPTIDEGATSIEVVDLVKLLSDKLGLKFPEGVDTVKEFNIAIEAMLGKTDDAAKDEPPPAEAISEQPAEEIPMQMRTRVIEALRSDNRAIQLRLKAIEDQRAAEKRAAFETRLNGFCKTGQLTPADIPAWLKLGEQASYQLSLLAPLERCAPAIPMGRVVGQHASAQPAEDRWAKGAATAKAVLGRK